MTDDNVLNNNGELPEGWARVPIKILGFVVTGNTPPKKDPRNYGGKYPWVKPPDLGFGKPIVDTKEYLSKEGGKKARLLPPGTTMVSCIGNLGKVGIAGTTLATNQQINSVTFHEGLVDHLFGYYFCKTLEPWLEENASATTVPIINKTRFSGAPFLLAPFPEQKRIVAKVEELLARVDAARERLEKVPAIMKGFRQAVLAAACSGRLTADWREEHRDVEPGGEVLKRVRELHEQSGFGHGGKAGTPTEGVHELDENEYPPTWAIDELKWLCTPGRPICYGILKPGPDFSDGVPYVRVAEYPNGHINLDSVRKTDPVIADKYKRSQLKTGDILLSIRGTAGRVCRVPFQLEGGNITQDTARISVYPGVNPDYVEIYLRSPCVQNRCQKALKGAAVRGVNIGDVRPLQIAFPPLPEQHEIVRRVEGLFALADKVEERVARARAAADKLEQAVLAKAFRGELVPTEAELARREGRDYEPAEVLLERVRGEREGKEKVRGRP